MLRTLALALLVPTLAPAAEIIECHFADVGTGGPIRDTVIVSHDRETDAVQVSDAIILAVYGHPIAGRLASGGAARRTFQWTVPIRDSNAVTARMTYRLTYYKAGSKAIISAVPQGYSNHFQKQGACRLLARS